MTVSLLTNITGVNLSLSLKTYEIGVIHIHSILMHYFMCLSILQFSCYNRVHQSTTCNAFPSKTCLIASLV